MSKAKIKIEEKAPTKLSDAVLMALEDMAKVEKSPTMEIDMADWHYPESSTNNPEVKCSVCMAGAVMHYKGKLDSECTVGGASDFSRDWQRVFLALDAFRTNNLGTAFRHMGYFFSEADILEDLYIKTEEFGMYSEYTDSPEEFKAWANKVVTFLKENKA